MNLNADVTQCAFHFSKGKTYRLEENDMFHNANGNKTYKAMMFPQGHVFSDCDPAELLLFAI